MKIVYQQLPDARLHLYNCDDPKMYKTFMAMSDYCKLPIFLRSLMGPVIDVVDLYNKADIVVSCLNPLYARTAVESLACGTKFVSPGYAIDNYPFKCEFSPESIAAAIIKAWKDKQFEARKWAEDHHSAEEMTKQALNIYEKVL